MRHAKLIHSFNSNTLKFIENWNSGYYNVKGFEYAESDIKELYLIKFFIEDYKIIKNNSTEIDSIIKESDIDLSLVKLSFDSYSKMIYLFRNYNLCIDSISKKFNIVYKELLTDFKERFKEKKDTKTNLFTYDIVSSPSTTSSIFENNSHMLLE